MGTNCERATRPCSCAYLGHLSGKCCCTPDAAVEGLFRRAIARLKLSARAFHPVLKLARTIAGLARSEAIAATQVAGAIQYRKLDRTL